MAADDSVLMSFTVKHTYDLECPIKDLAKLLKMKVTELRACVAGDAEFAPDATQIAALCGEAADDGDPEFELEQLDLDEM